MAVEFCSNCNKLVNTQVSTTITTKKDKSGKEQKLLINSYNCESCSSFIKSEEANVSKMAR